MQKETKIASGHNTKDIALERRAALVTTVTAAFLTPFMGSAVSVALPSIGKDLEMNAVMLGWVSAAYLLAAAIFLVPVGRLADIYGRKKIFLYGLLTFTVSSLLCGLAPSDNALIAFRFLQGLGSAMVFGTGMAILSSVYPPNERGKVLGITVAAVYIGLSLGPLLGGVISDHLGWRGVFLVTVPLGLLGVLQIMTKLKGEWAEARGERFDSSGSLLYSVSLVIFLIGLSILPDSKGIYLILVGISAFGLFLWWESNQTSPVLNVSLFRHNRVFAFSNLAALVNYSATFAVVFLLSLFLQYIQGFAPQGTGLIIVSKPLVMALFSPVAGRMSDRIEPRIVASLGMAITTISLIMLSFLESDTSIAFIVASLMVMGLGIALFSSPNTNAVMGSVDKKHYGLASGAVGTMRLVGQMLSMGLVMMLLAVYIGRTQITVENHEGFIAASKAAFAISAMLCAAGVVASLARGRTHD